MKINDGNKALSLPDFIIAELANITKDETSKAVHEAIGLKYSIGLMLLAGQISYTQFEILLKLIDTACADVGITADSPTTYKLSLINTIEGGENHAESVKNNYSPCN